MQLSTQQLNQLSAVALQAVNIAADYIKQFDRRELTTHFKASGSSLSAQVVTEVDLHCQALIIEQLQASCATYDIALLSEENCAEIAINEHPRLRKDYFWCIDPLDGTLPFIEGQQGYAVSVALVNKQGTPILSAINLPAFARSYQLRFDANDNARVYKNGAHLTNETHAPTNKADSKAQNKANNTLTLYCDRSFIGNAHYATLINRLTSLLPRLDVEHIKVISEHGAVVNALLVLENSPACYIKLPKPQQGGGALWDFSGTACITQALGGWVSDIAGNPLTLNQADSYYMHQRGVIYASNTILGQAIVTRLNNG